MFAIHQRAIAPIICIMCICVTAMFTYAYGQPVDVQRQSDLLERSEEQERRSAERRIQVEKQVRPPTVNLNPSLPSIRPIDTNESPCFEIKKLHLAPTTASDFSWLLKYADGRLQLDWSDSVEGKCLGAQGVQQVIDRLQNALVAKGFITSRVITPKQNLNSGDLIFEVIAGRIQGIRWASNSGLRGTQWNTVPIELGDIFNLRDLEQALENYKRVPTVDVDIQIVPSSAPDTSDLVIAHQQPFPFRLSATADDSGSRSTGKYQKSLTLSYDNWFTLSDLFYVTVQNDMGGGDAGIRGTGGRIIHYSVPFGYWLVGFTDSNNRYHQSVAGANQQYIYSGTSRNTDLKVSRVLRRDAVSKTGVSLKGFRLGSKNYIDDTEVEVQQRNVAGIEWGFNHKSSQKTGNAEVNLTYRLGTGAWGSTPAPEETFGEGTSRMRLWQFDLQIQKSLSVFNRPFQYSGNLRGQYNMTALTPQDRFSIGGRFTVRGFDGASNLSAERGRLIRNELSTQINQQIQMYVGLDAGQIAGPSASQLVGRNLIGAFWV